MLDANNRKVLQFSVKKNFAIGLATAFMIVPGMTDAYGKNGKVGVRIDAIQESAWDCSEWISVADAPVVTGPIGEPMSVPPTGAIFDGEEYDARELPGYATPEKLSAPEKNEEFKGKIFPSDGAEVYIREDLALTPVRAYVWKGVTGESVEEFGKVTD